MSLFSSCLLIGQTIVRLNPDSSVFVNEQPLVQHPSDVISTSCCLHFQIQIETLTCEFDSLEETRSHSRRFEEIRRRMERRASQSKGKDRNHDSSPAHGKIGETSCRHQLSRGRVLFEKKQGSPIRI